MVKRYKLSAVDNNRYRFYFDDIPKRYKLSTVHLDKGTRLSVKHSEKR